MTAASQGERARRRVLYVQYTDPAGYPPLEHSARLLADAGWDVLLLGIEISDTRLTLPRHDRIRMDLRPPAGVGWRQKLHYLRFVTWALSRARRWQPDWIYASDALSCPIALTLATACDARLVYHEHDSPNDATMSQSFFMRMVLAARRRVAARADLCVLPNTSRMHVFGRLHPRSRSVTVWNCPTRQEVRPPQQSTEGMRVLYHGSIVPARLPLIVIDALAQLPAAVTLVIAGYETVGHPGYLDALKLRARELGVASRVEFAGTVSERADLLQQCAGCHVGLALMPLAPSDLNEREMVGASNKPFDYMACGLALVVSDVPAWHVTFVDGGYALPCNPESPQSIADVLRRMLEDPEMRRSMGNRGRQRVVDEWNYERAFAPVFAVLNAGNGEDSSARHAGGDLMLAVIETHPIQYHAPVYRLVQQTYGIPVTAIYGSDFSVTGYRDEEFGTTFSWDTDLLSGYSSVFLSRVASGGAVTADRVSTRGLAQVLRDLNPAAVLTVGYSPRFHRDAWLAAWRAGCTILFRGETNDDAKQRSWWKQVGRDAALRAAYRTCSRLLYVGRRSRSHFERLGVPPGRLVFSPYCVDASPFDTSEAGRAAMRPQTRNQWGLSEDDCVLLFSGKLSWRKGVDLLVQAAKLLPPRMRARTVLAFLGDGPLQAELNDLAAATPAVRAVFLGFQNQHQLSRYYHAADLLVLPSRESETWGLVVNEGLHHGVPCIVSDQVGCGPDLIEERTGRVCAAGSASALATTIEDAVVLCGQESVRTACRAKVTGFTTDRAAAGIAEAYASAVGAGKAA